MFHRLWSTLPLDYESPFHLATQNSLSLEFLNLREFYLEILDLGIQILGISHYYNWEKILYLIRAPLIFWRLRCFLRILATLSLFLANSIFLQQINFKFLNFVCEI